MTRKNSESFGQYIRRLAKHHKLHYVRSFHDSWAAAVTRLADDEVKVDPIKDLLQALSRANKVSDRDFSDLLVGYLKEQRRAALRV